MKIAQVAPLWESVPPTLYGGTERVVSFITEELVRQGHDVTLFAAGQSSTRARCVEVVPSPLRRRMTRQEMLEVAPHVHLRMLADLYGRAGEFDVIHSHVDIWTLPFAYRCATPTVLTMHGRLDLVDDRDHDAFDEAVVLFDDAEDVETGDAGEAHVEQDARRRRAIGSLEEGFPILPFLDPESRRLQQEFE